LDPEDLAGLEELASTVRGAVEKAEALVPRLEAVEATDSHLSDRLRCVLEDSLRLSLRDQVSIHQEARGEG
jgi:hypothetical protein